MLEIILIVTMILLWTGALSLGLMLGGRLIAAAVGSYQKSNFLISVDRAERR